MSAREWSRFSGTRFADRPQPAYAAPAGISWLARGWERPEVKPVMMHYDFPLRRDMIIDLILPQRLSRADAARISAFVATLPFEQATP